MKNAVKSKTTTIYGTAGTGKTTTIKELYEDEKKDGNRSRVYSFSRNGVKDFGENGSTIHSQCSSLLGISGVFDGNETRFMPQHELYKLYKHTSNIEQNDDEDRDDLLYKRALEKSMLGVSKGMWDTIRNYNMFEAFAWDPIHDRCVPDCEALRGIYAAIVKSHNGYVPSYSQNCGLDGKYRADELTVDMFLRCVKHYEDWKLSEGYIDYTDTLITSYLSPIRPSENCIIIDEAHDLTPLQYNIVSQWIADDDVSSAYIFGDVAQMIYGWMGSSSEAYLEMVNGTTIGAELTELHRFGGNIWRRARKFIPYTNAPYDTNKFTTSRYDDTITDTQGIGAMAAELSTYSKKERKDTTMLAATNKMLYSIEQRLLEYDVELGEYKTFHGAKGDSVKNCVSCFDVPNYWVNQLGDDVSSLASVAFVGTTRAIDNQIITTKLFNRGYSNIERVVENGKQKQAS